MIRTYIRNGKIITISVADTQEEGYNDSRNWNDIMEQDFGVYTRPTAVRQSIDDCIDALDTNDMQAFEKKLDKLIALCTHDKDMIIDELQAVRDLNINLKEKENETE